nr:adhesion G protein-coupled receptor A2 [Pelodiscus sinensis]|eukprot:XP_025045896.1 adhesion G protein-coupled receptor A2 [Pelodiscus sinensis]
MQAFVHPGMAPAEGSQIFIGCSPGVAQSLKSSSSPSSTNSTVGPCKLTNLQVAQSQAESCPAPRPACCEEPEPANNKNAQAARHASNAGRRAHKSRAKQYREGKHQRQKALRGPAADHPSSESIPNSQPQQPPEQQPPGAKGGSGAGRGGCSEPVRSERRGQQQPAGARLQQSSEEKRQQGQPPPGPRH